MHRSVPYVMLLLAVPLAAQERFHLRNTFRAGAVNWIEQEQEISETMHMNGKLMEIRVHTSLCMERRVVDVKDGGASIDQRIARMKVKRSSADVDMNVDYDSDIGDAMPGPRNDMAAMVGQSIKARVDPSGKILDLDLPKELDSTAAATMVGLRHGFMLSFTLWPADSIAMPSPSATRSVVLPRILLVPVRFHVVPSVMRSPTSVTGSST